MSTRSRSRGAATRAAMTVLMLAALLTALPARGLFAGQPMTLSDDGGGKSRAPADTVRRSAKKTTPTTAAKTAPAKAAPAKAAPAPTTNRVAAGDKTTPKVATTPAGRSASVDSRASSGAAAKSTPVSRPPAQAKTPMVAKVAPPGTPKSGPTVAGPAAAGASRAPTTATSVVAKSKPQPAAGRSVSVAPRTAATSQATGVVTKAGVGPAGSASVMKASRQPTVSRSAPARGPSKVKVQTPVAALEDHVTYQYNALGRRDPFQSLMEGEYVGAEVGGAAPDLGGLKVVGIVWGSVDQFAMAEDVRGNSYVLRRGDRVMNGFVEGLKRDAMVVNITVDGQTQSVSIPVTRKGERTNASR